MDQSVDLGGGEKTTKPFTVNINERYWIQIAVDRDTPAQLQMNVLGTGDPERMQADSGNGVEIRWAVESAGKVVASGSGRGKDEWMIGPAIVRRLGYFRAEKGKSYVVRVDVLQDASGLAPFHPRLQVQVDGFDIDGYAIGYGVMGLFSLGIAGIAAIVFAVSWIVSRRLLNGANVTIPPP